MKKQVLGKASKQAPANRTIYFEVVKFHITGAQQCNDFTDIEKAYKCINAGREITAYYERHGFKLNKGLSIRTMIDPSKNNGMTPTISTKHIATIKRNCRDYDKLLRRIASAIANNGKQGTLISF